VDFAARCLELVPVVKLRTGLEIVNHVESLGNFLVPLGHFLPHFRLISVKSVGVLVGLPLAEQHALSRRGRLRKTGQLVALYGGAEADFTFILTFKSRCRH
jgi:hypothetical protein